MEGASRVQKRAGREFVRNLIVRNLIRMLAIFAVPAAILMVVAFIEGTPLRCWPLLASSCPLWGR
jgi:hypothetical protein